MPKLVAVYTVAGLSLFGALFAALALAGIGRPMASPEATTVASPSAAPSAPAHPPLQFVPPEMEPGRTYRISHDIPIYEQPDTAQARRETLPAGGYFTAVYTLMDAPGPWTQITVSDGFRDYQMYLLGTDLRWKVVTPVYSEDEQRDQKMTAALTRLEEIGARRRAQRALEEAAEEPVVQETPTFAQWWADRAERMGGANVANLVVAGLGSAVLTVTIIGAIVLLTLLRREHEWSRPVHPEDDAIDLQAEEDDPFTYSMGGSAYAGHDDEDQHRA